ncbi:hypothetical protein ACKWTF_003617 [Chironomus riparius]
MILPENLCRLCAGNLEAFVFFHNLKDFIAIQKLELPVSDDARICSYCYVKINKIQKFWEQSIKIQDFFAYINDTNVDESKLNEIKSQFDLCQQSDQCTDTDDLCKSEFVIAEKAASINDCGDMNNEHTFTELDDFAEIPTMAISEQNFVIENITESSEVADEIEISYNTIEDREIKECEDKIEDLDFSCHICNEEFKSFFGLYSHVRKIHDSIPQVQCSCGEILHSRMQINSHKKLHSLDNSYKCHMCDKVYSHHQSLQNHVKKTHAEQECKAFICSRCSREFDSERKLKLHEQVHLPDDRKLIHPCPFIECDKKFSKSVNVQAHIKSVHIKERPFLCSHCGKNFSTKGALKEHQIIHNDEYPHECKFCKKKFKNLPRLKTHEDIHSTTQYICNVCGISLNTKRTLKMHMVIHSDQKRFKCEFCQTSFKRSKALKNHLILHSGLRPYSCPFCDKTFSNGSNCRSHKKKAHPSELAAFEASGKKTSLPNIPRLDQLINK